VYRPPETSFRLQRVTTLRAAATVVTRHAVLAVGAIVALSTTFRLGVATTLDVPWIAPDEMLYGLIGESLWETGQLAVRGMATPYYSLLTPALVGLPLTNEDRETGLVLAQGLQALAMSLVAVPVYLWARRLTGPGWGLVAAALVVAPPALWYGGLLMTEALFYTTVTAALVALARMFETPTLERQGVFALMLSLAAAVRLQALLLLPALLLAAGLYAWFERSTAIFRRLALLLGVVAVGTVTLAALALTGSGDLLGAYGELASAAPSSSSLLPQLTWHVAALVVMTVALPLLGTAILVVLAAFRGESDPRVRAFLAVTTAYVSLLTAQVSVFAVDYLEHVSERYLITALPPLVVGLVVWIARGAPRPRVVALPLGVVAVALVATLPPSRTGTAMGAHDALAALPLGRALEPAGNELRLILVACALAAATAFVFLARRLLPAAVAVLGVVLVGISVASVREIDRLAALETAHDLGSAEPMWIDDAGGDSALLFDTGELPSTAIARLTFWNRAIRELVRLEDVPQQALPQVPVGIRRDGALTGATGAEVSAPQAVMPATIVLEGERVAETPPTEVAPGSVLWRVTEPLRLVSRRSGFSPIGDFREATVVVYRCGPGRLEVTLLGKDGEPIVARVNGFPYDTFELEPPGSLNVAIRSIGIIAGAPCVFELESAGLVGTTRVEWVPESP
jgi:hypothetical protein